MPHAARLCFVVAAAALSVGIPAQGWPLPPARTGNLYVSGFSSHNVGEFDKLGNLVRTMTHSTMRSPRGVAVEADGTVVVVVQTNSRILRMAPDGTLLQTITHPDLTSGTGISRSPSGEWYVGSFSPGRVVVFDAAWNYLRTLVEPGMDGVNCVSFDSSASGAFAVTAAISNRVYRFDAGLGLVGTVSHPNMASPMSIADDSAGAHYVSQGSSGRVIKFDANWAPLMSIGVGTLAAPQGIAVDANDVLWVSSFSTPLVHRFDTTGSVLGSFSLASVVTGRNMAWQTSSAMLAREGTVGLGVGPVAQPVLTVAGQVGDAVRRVTLTAGQPFDVALAAPVSGPGLPLFVLWASLGEPGPGDVFELPLGMGPMAFAPPFAGGSPVTLANGFGLAPLLGSGLLPATGAPQTVLSMPAGLGFPLVATVQGWIADAGSAGGLPYSITNAVVVEVR